MLPRSSVLREVGGVKPEETRGESGAEQSTPEGFTRTEAAENVHRTSGPLQGVRGDHGRLEAY